MALQKERSYGQSEIYGMERAGTLPTYNDRGDGCGSYCQSIAYVNGHLLMAGRFSTVINHRNIAERIEHEVGADKGEMVATPKMTGSATATARA